MKAIVLAGGYAKRLWPLTLEQAKPLVDINGRPIISYVLDKLEASPSISEIIISTNAKFRDNFHVWLATQSFSKPVKVVVENSANEGEKLGAVGGLNYVLENQDIDDDVLVVGGDNLTSVNIEEMIKNFEMKKSTFVAVHDIKNIEEVRHKFAEVEHDKNYRIIKFNEKPANPSTTLIATCCYIFPKGTRREINSYIRSGNNRDAPGFFVEWLANKNDVFAHVFDTYWFDIGDHATLQKAREFAKNLQN